jgi:hypothetical protein
MGCVVVFRQMKRRDKDTAKEGKKTLFPWLQRTVMVNSAIKIAFSFVSLSLYRKA